MKRHPEFNYTDQNIYQVKLNIQAKSILVVNKQYKYIYV